VPLLRGLALLSVTFMLRLHLLLLLLLQLLTLLRIRGAAQLLLMPRLELRAFGSVARIQFRAFSRVPCREIRRRRGGRRLGR